jgi:tRNA (adenine22-N1)-methyltransferase
MSITLTPRLSAVASLVKGGGIIADIGTDHGYLPIYLIQNDIVKGAIAADIGKEPLKNAERSVCQYELTDKIKLRLSDGLREFSSDDADEIIFAGMGGTLIAEKLEETNWIKTDKIHFIFQPQSRAEDLREFLYKNGFSICQEIATHEARRVYITFDAVYTGEIGDYTVADCFIGRLPHNEDSHKHISQQLARLTKKYEALTECGKTDETGTLKETIDALKEFING